MGSTIYEKILRAHTDEKDFVTGDIVEVSVDRVMIHDFFTPFCFGKFKEMQFDKVWDPDKVVIIFDHLVPASFISDYRHHRIGEEFAAEQGITRLHRNDGVCHQLMHEQGYVKPGDIVLGTDSHTVTYGALGTIATGIGYTEMAAVLGTGKIWMRAVPTIRFEINGALQRGVYSKDIILQILKDITTDGATYRAMEFCGTTIEEMSIDSRLTLSNMSVEAGAKTGIIKPDQKTVEYLKRHYPPDEIEMLDNDDDAVFEHTYTYAAEDIVPLVATPHSVDNVTPAADLSDITLTQAFLGSCTNGRVEDLGTAARIMKGKKAAPGVRFIVTPASREVMEEAVRKGYIADLAAAGAIVTHPSCGLCAGRSGGVLSEGDRIISSNNRNFLGRMGSNKAEIYLGSPATVAASALEGRIVDPREYIGGL